MNIREVALHEVESVRIFLCANGWAHRVGDPGRFAALVQASQRVAIAVEEATGEIVGFARAITDGVSNGYLSMVVVAAPYRRKGVGRRLVEHVIGADPSVTWVLRAGREGAAEFFASLGFSVSTTAMERLRA